MDSDNTKDRQQTFGEKAVGKSFNPSKDGAVDIAKQTCADAIDQMNEFRNSCGKGEAARLSSVAITKLQDSVMWMVKALTWKD